MRKRSVIAAIAALAIGGGVAALAQTHTDDKGQSEP